MPNGFPTWLWAILGAVLPVLYQKLFSKFPGAIKYIMTWGLSALIVVVVAVVFLHYSPGQILQAMAWLIAAMQSVYTLFLKPNTVKG